MSAQTSNGPVVRDEPGAAEQDGRRAAAPGGAAPPGGQVLAGGMEGQYWTLPADRSAAARARLLTWEALAPLGLDARLIEDGLAIVSELAANAIVHGLPPVELRIQPRSREVMLLVVDGGTGRPRWGISAPESVGGRGLFVVSAYSGGNCGTTRTAYRSIPGREGNAVWATLPRRPGRLEDLGPASAAALVQRWLTRRGLRNVMSPPSGGQVAQIRVAGLGTVWCLAAKLAWYADGAERVFSYPQLPELVEHICEWAAARRPALPGLLRPDAYTRPSRRCSVGGHQD